MSTPLHEDSLNWINKRILELRIRQANLNSFEAYKAEAIMLELEELCEDREAVIRAMYEARRSVGKYSSLFIRRLIIRAIIGSAIAYIIVQIINADKI